MPAVLSIDRARSRHRFAQALKPVAAYMLLIAALIVVVAAMLPVSP